MGEPAPLYSAEGLAVEIYDHGLPDPETGPTSGDIEFYLSLARKCDGPVLELGAGTGRVTWTLAREGIEVVGLDCSRPMLARAEAKRRAMPPEVSDLARFVESNMADFNLGGAFALAIAPGRAFQSLLTADEQRKSLLSISEHLCPGGILSLHLFDPRLDLLVPGCDLPMMVRTEIRHPQSDSLVKRGITQRTTDPSRQVFREIWEHSEINSTGEIRRHERNSLELRWTYRWEMRHLLELCGYKIEAEYSDFKGSPPTYGQEQVWVARHP